MRLCRLGVAIALLGAGSAGMAAELPFGDEDMPVVLSATRLKQAVADAPASITIIDRQMIEQTAVRELPELLRLVPGMVVGYDTGWDAFVSYHGTSSDMARRMQVLVNGRSIYQPSLANVDWIGLPLDIDDIDRIEVIRGPNAAAYGANSFFGVVNILTRHPADLPTVRASSKRGSDGIQDNFVGVSGQRDKASYQLSVTSRHDDGYDYYLNSHNGERISRYADDKSTSAIYGRTVWELTPETTVDLSAGQSRLDGENHQWQDLFLEQPVAHLKQEFVSATVEHEIGDAHQLQFQSSFSRFDRQENWRVHVPRLAFIPELGALWDISRYQTERTLAGHPLPTSNQAEQDAVDAVFNAFGRDGLFDGNGDPVESIYRADLDKRESRLEVELQDTWLVSPEFRLVYGAGIQDSRSDSQYYFQGKVENSVWRMFAHGEWQFRPDWRLNIGAMDEHDDQAGHYLSPRVALNWRFAPTHSLRLVTSKAYRTPDLSEAKANWRIYAYTENPAESEFNGYYYKSATNAYTDANPCPASVSLDYEHRCLSKEAPTERILSREIGYYGEWTDAHVQLDLRIFHDELELSEHNLEIDDFLIVPTKVHQQHGAELSTQWRPLPSWRLLFNYAYDEITGRDDNVDFVPRHSGNLAAWYDHSNGVRASLAYVFYNELNRGGDDRGLNFDRLDLRLGKRLALAKSNDLQLDAVWQIRVTGDPELRKNNGAPRDKIWLALSYFYE